MKLKCSNDSVSAIIGTMLLLIIAISLLSIIYMQVLSDDGPTPVTYIRVEGKVEGKEIIVEHVGGEPIDNHTWIKIVLPDEEVRVRVDELLEDSNNDGLWNIGERLIEPFEYNLSIINEYTSSDIVAVHEVDNCIIFMGPVSFNPVSDVSVEITVDNTNPTINDVVTIEIKAKCLGGDINASGDVQIKYNIPEGLTFISSSSSQGAYNNSTGLWRVGNILLGTPANLTIKVQVVGVEQRSFTQYCVLLDGSLSIEDSDWKVMKNGLASAIENGDLPHDGSIEFCVVQFGGGSFHSSPRAEIEIASIFVNDSNYLNIASDVRNINQMKGYTPTACAFYLGTDTIISSLNYSSLDRQVITLVSDGLPTYCCDFDDDLFIADSPWTVCSEYESSENARDYMVNILNLNEDNDEIDAIAISDEIDINWLRDYMVWPQPGNDSWPPDASGWVRKVNDANEFADTIDDIFKYLFSSIVNEVTFYSSTTINVNINNDKDRVIILPQS